MNRRLAAALARPAMALDTWLMRPRGVDALKVPPGTCGAVRGGRLCGKPAGRELYGTAQVGLCPGHERELHEAADMVTELLTRKAPR